MAYWLVKSDPDSYSWDDLVKDKKTPWDGVRNYQARNFMKEMENGDKVFVYHSLTTKSVVGIAEVTKEQFQDPTTEDERWIAVELTALESLETPVSLKEIKKKSKLENIALIKQSRLSVMPLTETEFNTIIEMSERD